MLNDHAGDDTVAAAQAVPSRALRRGALLYFCMLGLLFGKVLLALIGYASATPLFSYILSIPFCFAFLLTMRRNDLPAKLTCSPMWTLAPFGAGAAAWFMAGGMASPLDRLSAQTFAFVCFLVAGGFLFRGRKWMAAASFPVAFLFFLVPLPDAVLQWMETKLQLTSADAASLWFSISRTPVSREGVVFDLPGYSMQVGQECSGIQASWVLLVSTVLGAALFLKSPWRRAVLIAAVVPLGILRNGFRIMVIGLLCIHQGPHMIDSAIHRKGGPLFLALSLIPLAVLLWWLRRGENAGRVSPASSPQTRGKSVD